MAVKPLGEQPDERSQPPRVDENLIAIERLTLAGRTDADQMVPAANQRLALPRLDFSRCRIDPLQEDGVQANRDDPKQVAFEVHRRPFQPPLRKLRRIGGFEVKERANDLAMQSRPLHLLPDSLRAARKDGLDINSHGRTRWAAEKGTGCKEGNIRDIRDI